MKNKAKSILIAGVLLFTTLGTAQSQERKARDPQKALKQLTEQLSLTEEQQTKIKEIYTNFQAQFTGDPKNDRTVRKQQQDEIRKVLTPEQIEKMAEMRKKQQQATPQPAAE